MGLWNKFISFFKKDEIKGKSPVTKRSLHIGINDYPGTVNDLRGCVNDATGWCSLLSSKFGFTTTVLLNEQATVRNAVREMKNIVSSAKDGDHIVITYSGHGTNVKDLDGDEEDGRDEAICLYDGLLIDDNIRVIFGALVKGANLTFISDSCHSGSVTRAFLSTLYDESPPKPRFLPPEDDEVVFNTAPKSISKKLFIPEEGMSHMLVSGCSPTEYSYDASFNSKPMGAMSYYAIKILNETPDITYEEFYTKLRSSLPNRQYPQTPSLEGSPENKKKKMFI